MPTPTRPNILIVMLDQLTGLWFPDGPLPFLQVPHLNRLAERSLRFRNAYTPSPLCLPARAAFLTGALPSQTGVYDNAAEVPAHWPTFIHHLRRGGYDTCLAGKMHFVGPDQLHGFESRLTTDIYPADFGWTPDFRNPEARIDWWYHNLGSVADAGIAETSNQLEFDDETAFHAERWLYNRARRLDPRPWCLTVSFTHPHDPYVARRRYWRRYDGVEIPPPTVPALPFERHDPHARRLLKAVDHERFALDDEHIARARRAYAANLSYLDDQIGRLLSVLDVGGFADDTAILFCADHGDMLGERGLWFKMSFYEGSARVPLMLAAPGLDPGSIETPVSLLDVGPTLLALAGLDAGPVGVGAGENLLGIAEGGERTAAVAMEYAAEGARGPMVALRDAHFKFVEAPGDPPQLFDLADDPHEHNNLAADPAHGERARAFAEQVAQCWDLPAFGRDVLDSQARRHLVAEALNQGRRTAWDFQPFEDASGRYMRNHLDLNRLEAERRYPPAD